MVDSSDMSVIIDRVKEICITRKECDEKNIGVNSTINSINTRLTVIEASLKRQEKQSNAILTAVVGSVVSILIACVIFAVKGGAV